MRTPFGEAVECLPPDTATEVYIGVIHDRCPNSGCLKQLSKSTFVNQVGRARFLCQCILRDHGFQLTPRDIIANAGSPLARPQNARGWIGSPAGVASHILSTRGSLDHAQIAGTVSVLRRYVGQI